METRMPWTGIARPHRAPKRFRYASDILVGVHSVLRKSLRFAKISIHGLCRMDNLLKLHSLARRI